MPDNYGPGVFKVFEEADARLDQALSQQSSGEATEKVTNEPQADLSKPAELPELDKLERFKYEGREWTPQELKSAMMMQADYTRKTQEVAQERKYYENLSHDLRSVRENPALAEEFKKVYPEKFHSYLEYISQNTQSAPQAQQHQQQSIQQQVAKPSIDPEFKARFEQLESAWKEQEVQKAQAQLDAIYDKFSKKYEMADERVVTATAQHLLSQGTKLDESTWEKLFKAEHERTQERYQAHYKAQFKQQQDAGKRGRDAGPGGGTPGQAPVKRSFDEATAAALADLTGRR